MKRFLPLFGVLFVILVSSAALALPDYEPEDVAWFGLNELVGVGQSEGIEIEPSPDLDYAKLDPAVPLIFIYPLTQLDAPSLATFTSRGGRILLADDFGKSEALLNRLDVQRMVTSVGQLPHDDFVDGNPALPILKPVGVHPLLEGVSTLVANHPSIITNAGGSVVPYSAGGALVYDMNLGDGKVVLVADSSMFINSMLEVADNRQFASNALRYICRDQTPCKPKMFTKSFSSEGHFSRSSLFDTDNEIQEDIEDINKALERVLDSLPGDELLYYLSILLVAGLVVYVGSVFPLRKTRPYSSYVSDFFESLPSPQSEFDWNVSRFGLGPRTMNHALPMSILKEAFEELFLEGLGLWPSSPRERDGIDALVEKFSKEYLTGHSPAIRKKYVSELHELLAVLSIVPTKNRVFLEGEVHVSELDLLKFHRRSMDVLEKMGLKDEYDKRVRGAF